MTEPPSPVTAAPRGSSSAASRPRTVNTCMRCRRLKLKCDHGRPCRRCVRSNTLDECQYEHPDEEQSSPDSRYRSASPERKRRRAVRVCSRCRRLKLRCDQGKPCSSCVDGGAVEDGECVYVRWPNEAASSTTGAGAAGLREVQELLQRIKSLEEALHASVSTPPASPDHPSNAHRPQSNPSIVTGPSSHSSPSVLRAPLLIQTGTDIASLPALFPPPDECRRLLHAFQTFDLMFRLVHMPSFMRRAEDVIAIIEAAQRPSSARVPAASPMLSPYVPSAPSIPSVGASGSSVGASVVDGDAANSDRPTIKGSDMTHLSGFAVLVGAMLCGATILPQTGSDPIPPTGTAAKLQRWPLHQHATNPDEVNTHDPRTSEDHLRALMDTILSMCDCQYPAILQLEYVHAHLLAIYTHMGGRGGGPTQGWVACGRAYHAALLVGICKEDRVGDESLFDREMRRRVWWQIVQIRLFIADRLRIDGYPEIHDVPRPLIISDAQLDMLALSPSMGLPPSEPDTVPEWTYVDSKLDVITMFQRRDVLMARTDISLLDRLEGAHVLLDEYEAQRAPYLQGKNANSSRLPSWAQMQARVSDITVAEMYVRLYRAHFGSSELAANGVSMGSFALSRGLQATHQLVRAVKGLAECLMFGWLDLETPIFALWTCGMKSFTAGMVLAYSLIADPNNPLATAQMADFEAMIGILRSRRNLPGSSQSNRHALATLEQLRDIIKAKDRSFHHVVDPYTGKPVDMPLTLPDFANGEWLEWETIFNELFQDGNPAAS